METKKKTCPKCGQEDGSGQNHIHDMSPEHFVKCDIRSIMERDGVCYHCGFWIKMYEQHKKRSQLANYRWSLIRCQPIRS